MTKTVVVGMSGGVDSSVSALLLKQQGYRVIGIFMNNWEELDDNGQCSSAKDYEDVAKTCAHLDIPFLSVNFAEEYKDLVFAEFLDQYKRGFTPNPDILCNKEIKFKVFLEKALELGADYLATGHYCRTDGKRLLKGVDSKKDQSYFLCSIDGRVLDRVLFPIGHLEKSQVRAIARAHGIPTMAKKDSTGICFIGERKFQEFLKGYLPARPGNFCLLDGTVAGQHQGMCYYTIGQRKHLGLGGEGPPWFVVGKDIEKNVVYVERGKDHPALWSQFIEASQPVWIKDMPQLPLRCKVKIRHRQEDQACFVELAECGKLLRLRFDQPQKGVAPSQYVAFFLGEECLGGAVIERSWREDN